MPNRLLALEIIGSSPCYPKLWTLKTEILDPKTEELPWAIISMSQSLVSYHQRLIHYMTSQIPLLESLENKTWIGTPSNKFLEASFSTVSNALGNAPRLRDYSLSCMVSHRRNSSADLGLLFTSKSIPSVPWDHRMSPADLKTVYTASQFFNSPSQCLIERICLALLKISSSPSLLLIGKRKLITKKLQESLGKLKKLSSEHIVQILVSESNLQEMAPTLDLFHPRFGIFQNDVDFSIVFDQCFTGSMWGTIPFPMWRIVFNLVIHFNLSTVAVLPSLSLTQIRVQRDELFFNNFDRIFRSPHDFTFDGIMSDTFVLKTMKTAYYCPGFLFHYYRYLLLIGFVDDNISKNVDGLSSFCKNMVSGKTVNKTSVLSCLVASRNIYSCQDDHDNGYFNPLLFYALVCCKNKKSKFIECVFTPFLRSLKSEQDE